MTCHHHTFEADDGKLVAFVVSYNMNRRHMTDSQRAMAAAKLATSKVGNPNFGSISALAGIAIATKQAASWLEVSEHSVERARRAIGRAEPEVIEAVERGDLSETAAVKIGGHQPDEQRRQLSAHRERGGTDKRSKGTPKMKQEPKPEPRLRVVHDRDDGIVEQVFSLLHRLREVSDKASPDAVYAKVPPRLMHNLDMSLASRFGVFIDPEPLAAAVPKLLHAEVSPKGRSRWRSVS